MRKDLKTYITLLLCGVAGLTIIGYVKFHNMFQEWYHYVAITMLAIAFIMWLKFDRVKPEDLDGRWRP